jgi:hypothetical protein
LLSDKLFGPSVMPPQPEGIWQNPYSSARWETPEGEDRYRRALYTYWRRTAPYPSMSTFDSPSREFCVSRRTRTNTPLQALVTLNDPVYVEAAGALAEMMHASAPSGDVESQIEYGYRRAMGYAPTPGKLEALVSLHRDIRDVRRVSDAGGVRGDSSNPLSNGEAIGRSSMFVVANAIMNTDEFLTKE